MASFWEQSWFRDALPYAAGALAVAGAVGGYGAMNGWFDSSTTGALDAGAWEGGDWGGGVLPGGRAMTSDNGFGPAISQAGRAASRGGGSSTGGILNFIKENPELLALGGLAASSLFTSGEETEPPGADATQEDIDEYRRREQARWNAIPYNDYRNAPRYSTPAPVNPNYSGGGERRYFAEGGGIRHDNGYLSGPGDGMSDDIGAIASASDGRQRPVNVADGEYVFAADVVSGLGNGSTNAGVRALDDLQAAVRGLRTGGRQPPALNPRELMGL